MAKCDTCMHKKRVAPFMDIKCLYYGFTIYNPEDRNNCVAYAVDNKKKEETTNVEEDL